MNAKDVENKLIEKGYVHPESFNSVSPSPYMTYNEASKDVYTISPDQPLYSIVNLEENNLGNNLGNKQETSKTDCPKCKKPAMYYCECQFGEMMCSLGHVWYIRNGSLIEEDPHED